MSCAATPIPTERTVEGTPAEVAARIEAELPRLGFLRTEGAGAGIAAQTGNMPADWASCSPRLVSDGDDRRRMVTAGSRSADVVIALSPAPGGTLVTVRTDLSATYRNPLRASAFTAACRSTGVLESQLLAAAG
jgi:hypothetical protein